MVTTVPTIVLIHGAWHTPPIYQSFVDALRGCGYPVHCPRLPCSNGELPPNKFLPDDIACIRNAIIHRIDAGEHIVMVMHSYGGAVGTDAAGGLSLTERKAAGLPGGVIHLVYLCAYILPPGGSIWGIIQHFGREDRFPTVVYIHEDGSTFPRNPAEMFYNGAEPKLVEAMLPHLVRHSMESLKVEAKCRSWQNVPVTYVRTLRDNSVPTMYQDMMLDQIKKEGIEIRVETYDTNHSIFLTKQKEIVELIIKVIEDTQNLE